MTHLADGERVHDDLGGVDDFPILRDKAQRHCRRHQRKNVRLHTMPEPVRHDGKQPLLRDDALERDGIAAGLLLEVAALAVAGVDEKIFGQIHDSAFSRCPSSSEGSSA